MQIEKLMPHHRYESCETMLSGTFEEVTTELRMYAITHSKWLDIHSTLKNEPIVLKFSDEKNYAGMFCVELSEGNLNPFAYYQGYSTYVKNHGYVVQISVTQDPGQLNYLTDYIKKASEEANIKFSPEKIFSANFFREYCFHHENLNSEVGADYTQLRDLLAVGQWKNADDVTYRMMLQAVGRKNGPWLTNEELLNFPCTDLHTIDYLWVKYSNGRFGLSVQKRIYLEAGGKPDSKFYEGAWNKFGDRIGWRKCLYDRVGWRIDRTFIKHWISSNQITFDTSAPQGHLPTLYLPSYSFDSDWYMGTSIDLWFADSGCGGLFSRIESCKL